MLKMIEGDIVKTMNTIILPKTEYLNMHKTQKELKQRLNLVEKALIDFTKDEISLSYAVKLNKISDNIDNGKGLKFESEKEVKNYLNNL